MADKRMFSRTLLSGDNFVTMPLSAQALYFHLSLNADDEGFVNNPRAVMRLIGARSNSVQALIDRGFLIVFDRSDAVEDGATAVKVGVSGVADSAIYVIRHWWQCNNKSASRWKSTNWQTLKAQLVTDESGIYQRKSNILSRQCPDNVPTMSTLDKIRLEEIRLEEDKREEIRLEEPNNPQSFFEKSGQSKPRT